MTFYSNQMNESYQKLWDETKKYLQLRYDLLRVELLEKSSQIISIMLMVIIAILLGIIIFTYLSVLLLVWLETLFGSIIPGLCIVLGIHVLLLILVVAFRKQWFLHPLIKSFSKILYSNESDCKKEEV